MSTVADRIAEGNEYVTRHVYALDNSIVNEEYRAYERAYFDIQQMIAETFRNMVSGEKWSVQHLAAREHLMRQIARRMEALDLEATQIALDGMLNGYKAGFAGAGYTLDTSVFEAMGRGASTLPLLPNEAIRAQLLAPYEGKTYGERWQDNRTEFLLRVKNALVQSQIQGEGVYQAQKRLADALGIDIGRRTKADRAANRAAFARAEMIARTELQRAANNGAIAVYERNRDVLQGYEIKAALDERTCPICGALDGKRFEFGKGQRPPFHVRCRCTVLPVLIDSRLQDEIAGKRVTFSEWAARRGLSRDAYGNAYQLQGASAPVKAA